MVSVNILGFTLSELGKYWKIMSDMIDLIFDQDRFDYSVKNRLEEGNGASERLVGSPV